MSLRHLVWRELLERPSAMFTSTLSILLGVTALVAIRHVTTFSEQEVGRQLQSLGANVLVLPKSATLQNYYAADLSGATLPESHVSTILMANLPGVERLSPRLCVPATLAGRDITLTGILPQSEFKSKALWQSMSLFSNKHVGCKRAACSTSVDSSPEALGSLRSIEKLEEREVVLGSDVAELCGVKSNDLIEVLGKKFVVLAVLAPTGTVDDSRAFAHLHAVQRLSNSGEVINAIEVMGCCEDAAGDMVGDLSLLLPDAKVVTISQVVSTQVGVNRLMSQLSLMVVGILVLVGGASVASTISSNVRERRREIGTLVALGATPPLIARLFLAKALSLGALGGVGGCLLGVAIAFLVGSRWFGISITPLPGLIAAVAGTAIAVTVAAAYWPAHTAAKLDPCCCFQEV